MSQATPAVVPRQPNSALWIGTIVTLLGVLSNFFYFWSIPGEAIFPWLSLALPVAGVVFLGVGLKRAFGRPQVFRGRISGTIITVLALFLGGVSVFGFFHARAVPASSGAPRVGQKAPDFTLTNLHGQPVTLSNLLSAPTEGASGKPPKAVLLIFYRGYW
jgi:hypothetical protein